MQFSWISALTGLEPYPGFALVVFLLWLRLGALLLLTPVLHGAAIPVSVRVLLVLGLAVALALGVPAAQADAARIVGLGDLLQAAALELALGATLALGIFVAFAAISMAGRVI